MDKDLLYRFFEGHASLEDMKVVKEWAGASEENVRGEKRCVSKFGRSENI